MVCAGRAAGDCRLAQISRWYAAQHRVNKGKPVAKITNPLPRNKVIPAVSVLLVLIFSKYFYMASISSYYTFYLMQNSDYRYKTPSSTSLPSCLRWRQAR